MTPDQLKSCTYAFNTLNTVIGERTFFNTNARTDMVKCFAIVNALLEEDLLSVERAVEFDRLIASLGYQLERPYFSKYKKPLFGALAGMSQKARMNLFRKLKGHVEDNVFASLMNNREKDSAIYIENFVKRYGGEEHMNRLLAFA